MSRSALERLLHQQRELLDELDEDAQRRVLALFRSARLDLAERLEKAAATLGEDSFTARTLLSMQAQAQAGVAQLAGALEGGLTTEASRMARAGVDAILGQVETMEGPLPVVLRADLAVALQGESRIRRTADSFQRYGAQLTSEIEQRLALGLVTRGGRREVVKRLVEATRQTLDIRRPRASLIWRMEMGGVYDDHALAAQERLSAEVPEGADPLLARMDEAHDRRNHPFSRAAHGTTALVSEDWRVSVAAVEAEAARMGKGGAGIVWTRQGAFWVGRAYPAHFNDRGRRTCWRQSWGDPQGV